MADLVAKSSNEILSILKIHTNFNNLRDQGGEVRVPSQQEVAHYIVVNSAFKSLLLAVDVRLRFSTVSPFYTFLFTQVNKGDALCCEQALAMMDPSIFGSDAREFNPKRFLQNPDLKKKVSGIAALWKR